jgi:cytochrome P450
MNVFRRSRGSLVTAEVFRRSHGLDCNLITSFQISLHLYLLNSNHYPNHHRFLSSYLSLLPSDSFDKLGLEVTDRVLISGTALLVLVSFLFFFTGVGTRRKHKDQADHDHDLSPPRAPVTDREASENLARPDSPWFLLEMAEKIGSDIFQLTSQDYVVGDTETAREILLDKATVKPKIYQFYKKLFGTDVVFTRLKNDHCWHTVRNAINRSMSSSEVNRMNRIVIEQVDSWVKNTLEPLIANNESFDPGVEMSKITFRVIAEATLEYNVTDEEYESFVYHLLNGKKELARMCYGNRFRKWFAPLFSNHRDGMRSCSEVKAFGRKILDAYRQNPSKSSNNTTIKLLESPGVCVDDDNRIAEITNFLFAGHDSTGHTLSHTLVLLAKHTKIQDKLRDDLLCTDSAIRSKSVYMRNVVTESNRLLPASPMGSLRQVGRNITCKDDSMIIPKGAVVYLPQLLLHRNPAVFKDPAEFLPERWENATKAMKDSIFMFSRGQRNCPGQSLALVELYSAIPKLLTAYTFELEAEGRLEYFTTMKRVGARLKASKVQV